MDPFVLYSSRNISRLWQGLRREKIRDMKKAQSVSLGFSENIF